MAGLLFTRLLRTLLLSLFAAQAFVFAQPDADDKTPDERQAAYDVVPNYVARYGMNVSNKLGEEGRIGSSPDNY